MPKPRVPIRTMRLEDDLYLRVVAKAQREGTNFSAVVRAALERYVEDDET